MQPDQLLVERCNQIADQIASPLEIDKLDLAKNLRQLLLDDHPLVHKVNKDYRIKLSFHVGEFSAPHPEGTTFAILEDGLDPETRPPGAPSKRVNFDGFIKHTVLILRGGEVTVRDIIKVASDVSGGVHHGVPSEAQEALVSFAQHFGIGNLPAGIRQLQAIGRVTLRALRPLCYAITADPKFQPQQLIIQSFVDGDTQFRIGSETVILDSLELNKVLNEVLVAQHRSFLNKGSPSLSKDLADTLIVPVSRVFIPDDAESPLLIVGVGEGSLALDLRDPDRAKSLGESLVLSMKKRLDRKTS